MRTFDYLLVIALCWLVIGFSLFSVFVLHETDRLEKRVNSLRAPPPNCYAPALAAYHEAGALAMQGESDATVRGHVARAIQFDPELAALWEIAQSSEDAWRLFLAILNARAWLGGCPGTAV